MARRPYHTARQEHVGDMLDQLQQRGRLQWTWDYADSSAIYNITLEGVTKSLGTKAAEAIAQGECDTLGIRWKPVGGNGGETDRTKTMRWINDPDLL